MRTAKDKIRSIVTATLILVAIDIGIAVYNISARTAEVRQLSNQAASNRAKADLAEKQWLEYMQRTMQRWDALQFANPQLKVPRANEPQPPGKTKLSDEELRRSPTERPKP